MYFADTSALAKLYLPERGSIWLHTLDLDATVVCELVVPEMASSLARLQRERVLAETEARSIWEGFVGSLQGWETVRLNEIVLSRAAALLLENTSVPLRTLDAIHIAAALEVQRRVHRRGNLPLVLLTADERLESAARRLGVETDNPNRHV